MEFRKIFLVILKTWLAFATLLGNPDRKVTVDVVIVNSAKIADFAKAFIVGKWF